jgi:hypothetical protein
MKKQHIYLDARGHEVADDDAIDKRGITSKHRAGNACTTRCGFLHKGAIS